MREIKFRAWDKKNKLMRLICKWIFPCNHGVGLIELKDHPESHQARYGYGEVELMQYTGLKDKNGKEIYEGDIVKIEYGEETKNVRVIFVSGSFDINDPNCCEHCKAGASCWGSLYEAMAMRDGVEVIGNIYENPLAINN